MSKKKNGDKKKQKIRAMTVRFLAALLVLRLFFFGCDRLRDNGSLVTICSTG